MKTSIVFTSAAEYLLENIKKKTKNANLVIANKNKEKKRYFPDGEVYIMLPEVGKLKTGRVIVLHSGSPDPNSGLVELELILQILKDHAIRPEIFFTYFPYCRQDKIFKKGETNAAQSLVKKLVDYYKAKKIYAIDPHFGKMDWVEKRPIVTVSAKAVLVEKAKNDFGPDILFLSPDKGGKRRTGILGLKKERIDSFRIKSFSPEIDVKGRTVGIIDDILLTGGTLLKSCESLKRAGAKEVIALITHSLLDSGLQKVKKSFARVYLTNTAGEKKDSLDSTDLIVEALFPADFSK